MKQEKNQQHIFIEKLYFMITKKKGQFFTYFALFFVLSFLAYEKFPIFHKMPLDKMVMLDNAYGDWQKDPGNVEKYNKLIKLVNKFPSFGLHLQTDIVQRLLYENNDNFKQLGSAVLSRIDTDPPYFVEFAKISILISESKYHDAFVRSLALKDRLKKDNKVLLKIYPYNLLRISFLAKHLNDNAKELVAWNELETYTSEKETSFISEMEKNNQFNLTDYISNRKKTLSF